MIRLIPCCAALVLAACATAAPPPFDDDGNLRTREGADTCEAAPGQRFIGQRATQEVGSELLSATGTRVMRWVPPDTIITTDYRYGRLTVTYDESYIIRGISCG